MTIQEKQLYTPSNRHSLTFFGLLIMLTISTGIFGAKIAAQNDVVATENPVYRDPQPDQFFKKWLVLGPIPVSAEKTIPDQNKQKLISGIELIHVGCFAIAVVVVKDALQLGSVRGSHP